MVKKEVISIHIGQAGIQMGTAFWELYLLEHGIGPDGYSTLSDNMEDLTFESFFEDVDNNRFVPRTVFVDTEPNVVDEVRSGVYKYLFHPDQIISGTEDGANNFARGSFTLGRKRTVEMLERIRKSIESCELPQGFMLNHSLSGGTGSGLTSVLLQALTGEYAKTAKIQVPVFPGPSLATAIVEPYNCAFHVHSAMDATDLAFVFDNEALYEICLSHLLMHSPNYTNINRILALINSATTCSMRFQGQLNADLADIRTNLVPYPRIHFPTVCHVPLIHTSRACHSVVTTKQLLKDVFSSKSQMVQCNLNRGSYIAVMLNGRGHISPTELNDSIQHLRSQNQISFVEWSPTGFKIGLNNQTPFMVPESEIAFAEKSLTMICNSTAIRYCWMSIGRKFDLLFDKRAFVHWFLGEGMEETEFVESRLDVELLERDYLELALTDDEIHEERARDPERVFMCGSTQRSSLEMTSKKEYSSKRKGSAQNL